MNKFKEILEKYSQWIALGLGGLWLLYMVYAHLIASETAAVEVQGEHFGPAAVDQHVKETVILKLNEGISQPGGLTMSSVDYPQMVTRTLSLAGEQPLALAGQWPRVAEQSVQIDNGVKPEDGPRATGIPQPGAPTNVEVVFGKSIVTMIGANNAATPQRQLWATVFATVPMATLQQEFTRTGIDNLKVPAAQLTSFLKVEIVREEQINGVWGNPTIMVSQPVNLNQPGATPPPKWPAANKTGDQLGFVRGWAGANQTLICQPAFYNVVQGDNWHLPNEAGVQVGVIAPPPVAPTPPPVAPTPPRRPQPTNPQPRPRPSNPGNRKLPEPTNISKLFLQAPEPEGPSIPMVPAGNGNNGAPAGGAPGTAPAGPGVDNGQVGGTPPSAPFEPRSMKDVTIWAHDLTVQSGHTYRYTIRYTISNPLFTFPNLVTNANDAAPFSIDSPMSQPSKPVTIPDTTSFYIAAVNSHKSEVKVDVFLWNVGGVQKNAVTLSPGDMVFDPELKLTLVDVREIGANDFDILLVDENGNLSTRNSKADRNNQVYQGLLKSH